MNALCAGSESAAQTSSSFKRYCAMNTNRIHVTPIGTLPSGKILRRDERKGVLWLSTSYGGDPFWRFDEVEFQEFVRLALFYGYRLPEDVR